MSKWEQLPESRRKSLKKASAKYVRNNCDRLSINVPKGTKDIWLEVSKERGFESLAQFVRYCVQKEIDIDVSEKSDRLVDN